MRALVAVLLLSFLLPVAAAEEVDLGVVALHYDIGERSATAESCWPPVVCEIIGLECEPISTGGPWLDPLHIPPVGVSVHEECIALPT